MTLTSYIGMKLYYLGFRMQPLRVRRGMSLVSQIGILWSDINPDLMVRVMRGERMELVVDLRTKEITPAERATPDKSENAR